MDGTLAQILDMVYAQQKRLNELEALVSQLQQKLQSPNGAAELAPTQEVKA
jgi:hypothetical protein